MESPRPSSDELIAQAAASLRRGAEPDAEALLTEAVGIDPQSVPALKLLATLYWQRKDIDKATETSRKLVELRPDDPQVLNSLALCYVAQGNSREAAELLERACTLQPDAAQFVHNLARVYQGAGRSDAAVEAYLRVIDLDPGNGDALASVGQLLLLRGDPAAIRFLERAAEVCPTTPVGRLAGAQAVFFSEGSLDRALGLADAAVSAAPDVAAGHTLRGMILQQQGEFDEAAAAFERAISLAPADATTYWHLAQGKRFTQADRPLVEAMGTQVNHFAGPPDDARFLHFAMGKALDDLGAYHQAMHHYDLGNRIVAGMRPHRFDREAFAQMLWQNAEALGPEAPAVPAGSDTSLPIFIVGMFRSGTTLLEQILSSHPQVAAAGELGFWNERAGRVFENTPPYLGGDDTAAIAEDYVTLLATYKGDAKFVTDKQPENFKWLGLIHAVLPNAHIFFCHRHPVDTCLSLYMTLFGKPPAYSCDPEDLVFVYRQHQALRDFWRSSLPRDRFMEIEYEELVRDRERVTRAALTFCGLPWNSACLHPEQNRRAVRTASRWQVRQPVYTTSIDRWRNYQDCLGAFAGLL
ncbi:MAG: tetratricopeptide repeat-containing sulfotransferase family protein [Fimbriimonadaceae bacterium]